MGSLSFLGIAGVLCVGIGTFMLSPAAAWIPWLILAAGVLGVGYVVWDKFQRDGYDVDRLATLWQEVKGDASGGVKEFVAALRKSWVQLDKAMERARHDRP